MLSSLEITNFRTFSHLAIERLGRVNLIVGRNGVGKTTLLEALRLYGSIWPHQTIVSILTSRKEVYASEKKNVKLRLHSLFHGRPSTAESRAVIRSSAKEGCAFEFRATLRYGNLSTTGSGPSHDETDISPPGPVLDLESGGRKSSMGTSGTTKQSITASTIRVLKHAFVEPFPFSDEPAFLGGAPVDDDTLATWWDKLSLTTAEERVLERMRLIAPLQGIRFIAISASGWGRIAITSVPTLPEPVALSTLGDGVVRMFQLAVAMEFAALRQTPKPDEAGLDFRNVFPLVLVDEVETGVHHTLHADLWRFILRTARSLDVQVVATTHSRDCLDGFAKAVTEDEEADALVVRLESKEGKSRAVLFDRRELPIVAHEKIEVR